MDHIEEINVEAASFIQRKPYVSPLVQLLSIEDTKNGGDTVVDSEVNNS